MVRRNFYILEEPTIGLHQKDTKLLILLLQKLVDQGHTVLVIEHHLDMLAEADYIVEVGPESGERGGQICYQGEIKKFLKEDEGPTSSFLRNLHSFKG